MTLPILLSVPHAGLAIPDELVMLNRLSPREIAADGDVGAAEIYLPLKRHVASLVTTPVARAFVDMNRAENDVRKDGVVKTHTCWDVPIYSRALSKAEIETLVARYHRPYHRELTQAACQSIRLGVDCHTMADKGPPVGPDPGKPRPAVCLGGGDGAIPQDWLNALKNCFEVFFPGEVTIDEPFSGGHITRSHCVDIPWVQLELSREGYFTDLEKSRAVINSLKIWCRLILK
jgi:formiminoglutamase